MKRNSFFAFVFFLSGLLPAQEKELPGFIRDSLDSYILSGMEDWQIPGLSVAIVKDSRIIFIKGYGVLEEGKSTPVDANTIFMIGSNTKAFTATALTMLEHEKKLSLNDKVTKWIPGFRLKDPLASQNVTVRDLLCHRIGFETFQGDFTYWTSNLSREAVIGRMGAVSPLYDFRTQWGYCNAAYLTAGEVIPRVTGRSWEEIVNESIVAPLEMNRTIMLSGDLGKTTNTAVPYTVVNGRLVKIPFPMIDNLAPAASMSSSARDMCNWLIAQLDSGRFGKKQVIPADAISATRVPQTIIKMDPRNKSESHFFLYGLGFMISDRNGKLVFSHTGGVDGFLSSVLMVPEENLGIVVLTSNDQNTFFQSLSFEIRDAFLGLPFQNFSKQALTRFREENIETESWLDSLRKIISGNNKPPVDLEKFAGQYYNPVYGDIEVKNEKQKLNIYFSNHPGLTGKLDYIRDLSFLCTFSNPTMGIKETVFKTGAGKITGLTLRVADFVEFTPYEFEKKN